VGNLPDKVEYISQLNGGLRLDVPSTLMKSTFSTGMKNVKVTKSSLKCRNGYDTIGNNLPLGSPISTLRQFRSYDGTVHTVVFTHDGIYELLNDGTWSSITGTITWNSGYSNPSKVSFIQNTLLATDFSNEIIEWDGSSSEFSTISTSVEYKARDLIAFKNRMMYVNLIEDGNTVPQRVRWTQIGTYDNFTDGYAGFVDLVDTPDEIMAVEPLGESVVIYKENSIVLASWIGGKNVFSFNTKINERGLVAPRAVVNLGNSHLFLSHDNVYRYSGGSTIESVSDPIEVEMPDLIDSNFIDRSIATVYGEEVWFIVPMDSEIPDTAYVYNYKQNFWYRHKISTTGIGTFVNPDNKTIGSLKGDIGSLGGRIGNLEASNIRPNIVIGDKDGYVYQIDSSSSTDNGTKIENYWDSKDFVLGEEYKTRYNRFRSIDFDARGDSLEVLYSTDGGESWNYIGETKLDSSYEWYTLWFDTSARKIRFRFRNYNTSETFSLRTFKIVYREGATR